VDFNLSEDQVLLKDAIDRLIQKEYSFEQRRRYGATPEGWSRTFWGQLARQSFLALPFAAEHGGLDGSPQELMLVMEALGRGLVLEPYFSSVVVAGSILRHGANEGQLARLVPRIAAGELLLALAHTEKQSRYELNDVLATAGAEADGYVLNGTKIVVIHGDCADLLLVPARSSGGQRDRDGISLFLVGADAAGLRRRRYRTQDGLRAADLRLEGVRVDKEALIGPLGGGLTILERAADEAIAALAAESVGCMQALLDLTVNYLKQRNQFGGPIGRFQALQHRAAEMLMELEQARSMAMYAALMVSEPDPIERRRAMSEVKVQISKSGRFVAQQAVQLHGGIGVTEEYSVGHYFKRLTMMEALFGDSDHHLARLQTPLLHRRAIR
jgi:pimeloyl-CoA dehydrogenase small subunit